MLAFPGNSNKRVQGLEIKRNFTFGRSKDDTFWQFSMVPYLFSLKNITVCRYQNVKISMKKKISRETILGKPLEPCSFLGRLKLVASLLQPAQNRA